MRSSSPSTWASAPSAASSRMSGSGLTGLANKLTDRASCPLQHDSEPRRQELFRLRVVHPAPFVVLGAAELERHRELDLARAGLGEEVARGLAAGVGEGVL